jgi:hypothetical protein
MIKDTVARSFSSIVLRQHVLRHVHMRMVLREKDHRAAEPWNRRQSWPPLSHKMRDPAVWNDAIRLQPHV